MSPWALLFLAAHLAAGEPTSITTLTATPAKPTKPDHAVTLQWSNLPDPSPLDYVAVYSPPSSGDLDYLGFLFLNSSASWATGAGSLTLPRLPDLRAPYQFRLFRGPPGRNPRVDQHVDPLPDASRRAAVSGNVAYEGSGARPAQLHLAFTDEVDEMRVLFVCGDGGRRSVRYGPAGRREEEWEEAPAEVSTYEQRHMCGYPANHSVGWRHPGFVFDGVMEGLRPGSRYFYKVGNDLGGWSETYSFISRDTEANETIAFLFGDLGTYVPYNTYFRTPQESLSTVKWILRDLQALNDKPAVISHIGDISYAKGYAWLWDHFFEQIEPIAANTPYHVCIGNHEYDWPSQPWKPSWAENIYGGNDAGGECGVPYSIKFKMPGNSSLPTSTIAPDTRNLYYSSDAGVVHFVYMSTETDFTHGSDQYNFIKADLERLNRSRTPFVVFQGHRPMYTSSNESKDTAHREQMIQHLEPLFVKHGVTLALWGHVHRYERFCPMKNYQCLNTSSSFVDPGAPVHVVIGMAGQDYQASWEPRPDHPEVPIFPQPQRSMYRGAEFGYAKLVATREKLTLTYIGNHDGQVHDMVEIFSPQFDTDSAPDKLVGAMPKKMRYLGIASSVMLAMLLGFMAGFAVRRKTDPARWSPVQDEES
ncbi:probable inactive purple acid phosphatase 2 [Aegilops tauschii subsp. strangulata]|uniref:Purple acid phosphatase n=1 Tax=Aegilops tauschii subsp. strangulata TaxID=200361 RepID=A0A453DCN9_AEGTS|nr:probable inactive purple acid phosphatase 2 [Aegilops tauschii subsp. strangulata]XP_020189876.1 probable inactive purple acid phosphatase 2 [Aegilops tauschii subsp. strangulata]XP_040256006.1 probable inactive purple acid phosphatase 2 [Aegilops tauschii subsp. strangulata]